MSAIAASPAVEAMKSRRGSDIGLQRTRPRRDVGRSASDIGFAAGLATWVAVLDTRGCHDNHDGMPAKNGRNVSLTAENEALVKRLVDGGRYASASEVVRDGLRLLERQEHERLVTKWLAEGLSKEEESTLPPELLARVREQLNVRIREGLDSIARGQGVDGEACIRRLRARRAKGQKGDLGRRLG